MPLTFAIYLPYFIVSLHCSKYSLNSEHDLQLNYLMSRFYTSLDTRTVHRLCLTACGIDTLAMSDTIQTTSTQDNAITDELSLHGLAFVDLDLRGLNNQPCLEGWYAPN